MKKKAEKNRGGKVVVAGKKRKGDRSSVDGEGERSRSIEGK